MFKLKELLPPLLYEQLRRSSLRRYGWFGDYQNWRDAKAASVGYDSDQIIQKVLDATIQVRDGKYPYERDSVLFDTIQYDWPLLAGLMWVAARNKGQLNVMDFGGSLGSTYWQNRKFLDSLPNLRWNIVEQKQYVDVGKTHLENNVLKFYADVASCIMDTKPNLILLSSVLSYIEDPFSILSMLSELNIEYMILERVPFITRGRDRLTVQHVPPKIYTASYPAWFFDRQKFLGFIQKSHKILELYECGMTLSFPCEVQGLVLMKKS